MARLTPEQAADKLIRRGQAAVQDYVAGVKATQESPTALAAKALPKAKLHYDEAVDSGRMERRLMAVSKEQWQAATVEKGQSRYAPGLSASRGKSVDFFTQFLPYADKVSQEVNQLSDVSIEDSIARASLAIRRLHEFQRR